MMQGLQPPGNPPYKIKQSLIVAKSAEMRVIDQTLAPGEAVPWHLHPDSDDCIICLRGELEVREINPEKVTTLRALERCLIPRKRPHTTVNASSENANSSSFRVRAMWSSASFPSSRLQHSLEMTSNPAFGRTAFGGRSILR